MPINYLLSVLKATILVKLYKCFSQNTLLTPQSSDKKTEKEYKKFILQRLEFDKDMDILLTDKRFAEFQYPLTIIDDISFQYPCSKLTHIENADIKDIITKKINCLEVIILKQGSDMDITIKIESKNLLTYSEEYDKFKEQKGSRDT